MNHGLSTIWRRRMSNGTHIPVNEAYREENMASRGDGEREDDSPVPAEDTPALGDRARGQDDHGGAECDADDEREPEALEDLGPLEPEVGSLDLLFRCAPGDVVAEHVREEGLGEVN